MADLKSVDEKRRDDVLKRMPETPAIGIMGRLVNTPPKPHDDKGATPSKATAQQPKQKGSA